ncbi:MAG: sigma-70 family RNA polymerase sigma factor [Candidatus Korobacteraceae bacterium]
MLNTMQEARTQVTGFSPQTTVAASQRREVFERNRHHVYAVAFWMTGNELAAEDLMSDTFREAFLATPNPSVEDIDRALAGELKKTFDMPVFTLDCVPSREVRNVRSNILRTELELAVIELPPTEKFVFLMHDVEGYDCDRAARLIGITERESRLALHQARLRVRELLVK